MTTLTTKATSTTFNNIDNINHINNINNICTLFCLHMWFGAVPIPETCFTQPHILEMYCVVRTVLRVHVFFAVCVATFRAAGKVLHFVFLFHSNDFVYLHPWIRVCITKTSQKSSSAAPVLICNFFSFSTSSKSIEEKLTYLDMFKRRCWKMKCQVRQCSKENQHGARAFGTVQN